MIKRKNITAVTYPLKRARFVMTPAAIVAASSFDVRRESSSLSMLQERQFIPLISKPKQSLGYFSRCGNTGTCHYLGAPPFEKGKNIGIRF